MGKKKASLVTGKSKKSIRDKTAVYKKKPKPKSTDGLPTRKDLTVEQRAGLVTQFMQGNNFWMLRSKHGREKIFKDPALLQEAAVEYFQLAINNPWVKKENKLEDKKIRLVDTPLGRPFTLIALSHYMHVNGKWFEEFEKNLKPSTNPVDADFSRVISWIRETINNQKMEGAALGVFNATLMSYDLGMRRDVPVIGSVGLHVTVINDTSRALLEEVRAKLEEIDKEE